MTIFRALIHVRQYSYVAIVFAALVVVSCGGGGSGSSGGGPTPPAAPDFYLAIQPSSVSLKQGDSATVNVSLTGSNGFTSSVTVSLTGLPDGVTASPATFTLSPDAHQDVSLTAALTAAVANVSVTVNATSGSLRHTSQLAINVTPTAEFSFQVQPATVLLAKNSSANATISITGSGGFNSAVAVTLTGMPDGVTATPSSFSLNAGGHQDVVIAANQSAAIGVFNLAVHGTSGSLSHTSQVAVAVLDENQAGHPPIRTRIIRTDAYHDGAWLAYFPQPITLYEPVTKRFFMSSTWLNRIDVFDAATETQIGQITVPGAFTLDESPDHSTIWVGTAVGDLYKIDPVTMTVKDRIPAIEIGPIGYAAYEVKVLADGRLALLGDQGGIPEVDGYATLGIWNPADNSLRVYGSSYGSTWSHVTEPPICGGLANIAEFAITPDRTKLVLGSHASDGTMCVFDTVTGRDRYVGLGDFIKYMLPTPDGKNIVVPSGGRILIYDTSGLFKTDDFTLQDPNGIYEHYLLTPDGNTLYATQGDIIEVYDLKSHAFRGTVFGPTINDLIDVGAPQAIDPSGLIAAVIGRGIAFIDGSNIIPRPAARSYMLTDPYFGPAQGGTTVSISNSITLSQAQSVYFGAFPATSIGSGAGTLSAVTPVGHGVVDVVVLAKDGSLTYGPDAFSYGPTILNVLPNKSVAVAGGDGYILGYGFGPHYTNGIPSDLHVSVGGKEATIVKFSGQPPDPAWYPFPLQYIQYTIPDGTAGTTVDVSVTNAAGTAKLANEFEYLPDMNVYPLAGGALVQGIYDRTRDRYYFTDASSIRVFSPTQKQWLTAIPMPATAQRLWGIALSPNGRRLVVGDAGAQLVFTLDPDNPAAVSTFTLPNAGFNQGNRPCGIAITDSGIVYYTTFSLDVTGAWLFHKLDTSTGIVTDFTNLQGGALGSDAYVRMYLSDDNARVFFNYAGSVITFSTATEKFTWNPVVAGADYEMAIASNGTWMASGEWLLDTNMNPLSFVTYDDREAGTVLGVYGQKLSPDGRLLFQPLASGIDVIDGMTGKLRARIALAMNLSRDYDALVSNGKDNMLLAIGDGGDGIAFVDLTSLQEPNPLPFESVVSRAVGAQVEYDQKLQKLRSKPTAVQAAGPSAARMSAPRVSGKRSRITSSAMLDRLRQQSPRVPAQDRSLPQLH